jgi:hypothetical protein
MGLVVSSIDSKEREAVRRWHELKDTLATETKKRRMCFVDLDNISYNPDKFDVPCLRDRILAVEQFLVGHAVDGIIVACNKDTAREISQEKTLFQMQHELLIVESKKDAADAALIYALEAAADGLESAVLVTMDRSLARAFAYFASPELRKQLSVVGFYGRCNNLVRQDKNDAWFNFGDSKDDLDKFLLLLINIQTYRTPQEKK